jgi:hypothetical protein
VNEGMATIHKKMSHLEKLLSLVPLSVESRHID